MGQFPNKSTQFKPGNPGGGRPKGTRNWSSIVQKLLADETLADKVINNKAGWWDNLPNRNLAEIIAAAMMLRAAVHSDVAAATWLRVTGYGNSGKYVPDSDESVFSSEPRVKVILPASIKKEIAASP